MMKRIASILIYTFGSLNVQAQFTEIPTGTDAGITELVVHGDTLIMSGYPNFFAKYYVNSEELVELPTAGKLNYGNKDLQVIDNNYYLYSGQGAPYDYNYILKSVDYGYSWDTLFNTPGLFYTFSMLDSTFGVLGGAFGSNAITNGSDNAWELQDSLYGVLMSSATYNDSIVILEGTSFSYISYDRGVNWNYISGAFLYPTQTEFLNKDTIISISNSGGGGDQSFFSISMDGGENWNHSQPCNLSLPDYDCFLTVYQMSMNEDGVAYILSYIEHTWFDFHGEIIDKTSISYSADYGTSWSSFVTDYTEKMYSMVFVNDSLGFIGGENGLLLKWDLTEPLQNILETANENSVDDFSVYPNPIEDYLYIKGNESNAVQFEIYSMTGQRIFSGWINDGKYDLTTISSGQYIFKAILPEGIYMTRIVKL